MPVFSQSGIDLFYGGFKYEDYTRDTGFFRGYTGDARFLNRVFYAGYISPGGYDYSVSASGGFADVEDRGSRSLAYGYRLAVARDLWGDLVVLPQWKVRLEFSDISYPLEKFRSRTIDISYDVTSMQLSLSVSKKYDIIMPYAGIGFYYAHDRFIEKFTGEKEENDLSGVLPFAGLALEPLNRLVLKTEVSFESVMNMAWGLEFRF